MRLTVINRIKPFFITTPIFYVNSIPHIGHLYSALLADAYVRWSRMKKNDTPVLFTTGTDEHGTKIQKQAVLKQMNCIDFCNEISGKFRNLFDLFDIKYNDFVRTTDERHKLAVTEFWNTLVANGFIYKSTYEGWYSINDETFLTDNQIENKQDIFGRFSKISKETGHEVQRLSEVNYHFKLTDFRKPLKQYLNEGIIMPEKYKEFLYNQIDDLNDLSVSRETSRQPWGIQVPNDSTQVIYVWLDALVNYLTACGYPNDKEKFAATWPADVHIVGKDILKFHAIYWPAFLFAAKMKPPKRILCHGHWLINNKKMSKSIGNVIDPLDMKDTYTTDGLRYFLLRDGIPSTDNNISTEKILNILNAELCNITGNLFTRCNSESINKTQIYPSYEKVKHCFTKFDMDFLADLNELRHQCDLSNERFNFYESIQNIMSMMRRTNSFIDEYKLWNLAKDERNRMKVNVVLFIAFEVLRIGGILLQPITPNLSANLLDALNVDESARGFDNATVNRNKNESTILTRKFIFFKRIKPDRT